MVTADEIRSIREHRAKTNHETYKQIFQTCTDRIQLLVRAHPMSTAMTFDVPPFVIGRPVYDVAHAKRYVIGALEKNGFKVRHDLESSTICIDWSKPRKKKKKKRPPREAQETIERGAEQRTLLSTLTNMKKIYL